MNKLEKADKAYELLTAIRKLAEQVKVNFVALVRNLKEVRDNDYHTDLGYDSFADFVRDEETAIGFKYNTVRAYIHLYEVYAGIDRLGELEYLGPNRAQIIMGRVKEDPDEWIAKAETLSSKDLINETRLASGKEEMPGLPPPDKPSPVPSSYIEYCKRGCAICGASKTHPHHYPHTRKMTDNFNKTIPLCDPCHQEFHDTPWSEWMWHRKAIVFLFNYILRGEG